MGTRHDHPNNSAQVRDLLQPDLPHQPAHREGRQHSPGSRAASRSSPSSPLRHPSPQSPSASSCASYEGREPGGGDERRERGASPRGYGPDNPKPGKLTFSASHAVLIDALLFNATKQIIPMEGRDMWRSDYVKIPCSPSNVVTIKTGQKKSTQMRRWDLICKELSRLASKKEVDIEDVQRAIININPKYENKWRFDALYSFVKSLPKEENYFHTLIPKMAALALTLPEQVKKGIPLLRTEHGGSITLSQLQISCLLANAFFCTFPHRNATEHNAEYHQYPSINFSSLFGNWSERKKEKLRAIMHYFNVMTDEKTRPQGLVTFERRSMTNSEFPHWRSSNEKMSMMQVRSEGTIETDGAGLLQVDFAASWIGGGVLSSGLVQEEILFLMNPELIVSRLFTERLADNECLIVTGSQQFSEYTGFGDSFEWAGPHKDDLQRDDWCRLKRQILAIDALNFKHRKDQYSMGHITRELNKAYCGFKGNWDDEPDIATGKWGCGVFNGDPQLKAVIQQMAAAKAKRGLVFFTFGDEKLMKDLQEIYHLLATEGITIERLYGLLEDYCAVQNASSSHVELLQFLTNTLTSHRSQL